MLSSLSLHAEAAVYTCGTLLLCKSTQLHSVKCPGGDVTGVEYKTNVLKRNKADLLLELLSVGWPSHGAQLKWGMAWVI